MLDRSAFDWSQLEFYESADNLRGLRQAQFMSELDVGRLREITASLIQGRLYHAAAAASPLEIRPLLIFYSMVAFAKAVAMFRKELAAIDLTPSHGFSTTAGQRVVDLTAIIRASGTFQHLNDAVAPIQQLPDLYRGELPDRNPGAVYIPVAASERLANKKIGLREILARIGPLSELYERTFSEPAKTISCRGIQKSYRRGDGHFELALSTSHSLEKVLDIHDCLKSLHARFPFLRQWTLIDVTATSSLLVFSLTGNHVDIEDNIHQLTLYEDARRVLHHPETLPVAEISERTIFPLAGTVYGGGYFAESFEDLQICDMSLYYLGMGMLGAIVRYHPHLWIHALTRSAYDTRPADDRAVALLSKFMELSLATFPRMVLGALLIPRAANA